MMKNFLKFSYSEKELKDLGIHFVAHDENLYKDMERWRNHDKLWKEAKKTNSMISKQNS